MRKIGFGVQLPTVFEMAGDDRSRIQGFDEVQGLIPCFQDCLGLDLLDPVIPLALADIVDLIRMTDHLPDVSAPGVDGITAYNCPLGRQPEQSVIYTIALERTKQDYGRVLVAFQDEQAVFKRSWLRWTFRDQIPVDCRPKLDFLVVLPFYAGQYL